MNGESFCTSRQPVYLHMYTDNLFVQVHSQSIYTNVQQVCAQVLIQSAQVHGLFAQVHSTSVCMRAQLVCVHKCTVSLFSQVHSKSTFTNVQQVFAQVNSLFAQAHSGSVCMRAQQVRVTHVHSEQVSCCRSSPQSWHWRR